VPHSNPPSLALQSERKVFRREANQSVNLPK
jgi:hypothetical protein